MNDIFPSAENAILTGFPIGKEENNNSLQEFKDKNSTYKKNTKEKYPEGWNAFQFDPSWVHQI